MLHKIEIVEAPEDPILTLEEVKTHLHVSGTLEDDYLMSLNKACESAIARYLNRTLLTTSYEVFTDRWCKSFDLPFPKLQSVESIKYFDINGEEQTLDEATYYWVVTASDPGKVVQKYDASYPELQYGRPDSIKFSITCGYGDDATHIPEQIKHAIKLLITNYYEHRGDIVVGSASAANIIPMHVSRLIHDLRIYQF